MQTISAPPVSYRVKLLPAQHELHVEMVIKAQNSSDSIRLQLPTWTPGRYSFLPTARDLFSFKAQDLVTGNPVPVHREGWQAFRVGAPGPLLISYTASAYDWQASESCGLLDGQFAVLTGARYLYSPTWAGPCRVTYEMPDNWKIHHSAGARRVGAQDSWDYPSYEVLLDSPVVMGNFDQLERNVKGTTFYFNFVDRAVGFDSEVDPFVDSLAEIAEEFFRIFRSFPFEHYTFIISTNPLAHWGLEHMTSSMCGVGPEVFIDPEHTARGKRVCAHELFHAWNVRRLRPAPLKEPDLYKGTFTEGLWMAEGFTRYYELLACVRTRIYTPEQFFSSVVNYYRHLTLHPAYYRVTAVDSSYATYLNHRKYPGQCNNSIDYYAKGMLIAFDLDAELRLFPRPDSLDEAFRDFYEQYADSKLGYTTADVLRFFEKRQAGLAEMLAPEVKGAAGLSTEQHLRKLGFELKGKRVPYLGLAFENGDSPSIYEVIDDSPAGQCGIAPGDVIMGIGEFAFSMKALIWLTKRRELITLQIKRGHRSLCFTITPGERFDIVEMTWQGSAHHSQRLRNWFRCDDFQPEQQQAFSLDFYENFHGILTLA